MAFKQFQITHAEETVPSETQPGRYVIQGRIEDTAIDGEVRALEVIVSGEEYDSLPTTGAPRRMSIRAILKREVAKAHVAWIASIQHRAPSPQVKSLAQMGGDLLDLNNPAPEPVNAEVLPSVEGG